MDPKASGGDGERPFRIVLADAMLIQHGPDRGGSREIGFAMGFAFIGPQFFVKHAFANGEATVADIDARTLCQLSDFGVRFAAETTQGESSGMGHDQGAGFSFPLP